MTARAWCVRRDQKAADHGNYRGAARFYSRRIWWTGHDWTESAHYRRTVYGSREEAEDAFGYPYCLELAEDTEAMVPAPVASGVRLTEAAMTDDDLVDEAKLALADEDKWPSRARRW